ncbi:MAG: cadherin-like domain-containing protein, partial [Victivallales bacterium]|nr:cadherin-like domain-containing protein [Victivallales bacterium]
APAYSAPWATSISPGPADEVAQTVQFSVSANTNTALFSTQPAVAPNGQLTFELTEDANGDATITLALTDNGGTGNGGTAQSASVDFDIKVAAKNDRPTFTGGGDVTVDEDSGGYAQPWASAIVVGPADENGQTPTFTAVVTLNAALFAVQPSISANGQLSFTPTDNAFGSATVSVTLADGGAAEDPPRGADHGNTSDPVVFTIDVTSVNDAPVITTDPVVFAVDEDDPDGTSVATLAATDTEGDTRNWTIESNPNFSIGLLTGEIKVKVGAALDHEDADSHQLLVTVTDDGTPAEDDTVTVTIDVGDVNEAPVAAADYATAKQGETVVISVLANDADPDDGDALDVSSVTIVGPVTGGTPTPEADGTVSFVPPPGFTGTATFSYTVDDGFGVPSNVATVDVVVGSPPWFPLFPVPDPPDRAVVSFVQVRIENGAGDTQLTAVLPIDDAAGELIFRPEDYMTGEGVGTGGLLPGTYTPYFAYWVENDGDFGEEQEGNSFVVSYEEPAAPTGVDVRGPSGPLAAPVPGGARFAFQLPTTQGYVLEVADGGARAVVARLVRPLARPAEGEAFPVALAVSNLFIPLIPGDYSWRVRGYNPLAPADPITRAEAWSDGNPFTVTAPAPAGAPGAPDLLSPGGGIAFNPNAATGKAMVDFFWTAVPGATDYYVYVGLQEGTAVVNNEETSEPSLLGVSLRPGTYRWAAMAFNAAGRSAWSVVGEFTVNPAPGLALVTGTYEDPSIVFDWIGIAPHRVELYVVDEGAYRAWLESDLLPDQPYTPSGEQALPGHTYWFRTRSVGVNGERGIWSDWGVYQIPEVGGEVIVAAAVDLGTDGQVTFTWDWANMPAGGQVKLRVLRTSNYSSAIWTDTTGADGFVVTGDAVAAPRETYYIQVRPLDADGNPLNGWTNWQVYDMPDLK